jgi:predicted membrane-bound spermidine synthase
MIVRNSFASLMKYLFSYFMEFSLERKQSQYSGEVEVTYSRGQYKLSTKNAIYSFGKHYTSFAKAFAALEIQHRKIQSVLVLGFGLGSVVDLLGKHPSVVSVTAVDADEVILSLAGKYLHADLKDKVTYIAADAEEFMHANSQQFDLILFDVFIGDETPVQFMQEDFFTVLKSALAPQGMLVYSKIEDSQKSKIENAQFAVKFAGLFPKAFSIDTNGNRLYVWENRDLNA